ELLARLRAVIGPELPLVASLDLHANLSPAMVALSDLLIAYRTYPHIDMAETGARAAQLLERVLKGGRKPAKAMRRTPFLIPVVWQSTLTEPARTLYGRLSELERGPVMSLSFAAGFPPADIPDCGPCVLAYGWEQAATEDAAERMAREITEAEPEFRGRIWKPREAGRHAIGAFDGRPVVLADTEDNPGAGAESDGIAMLEALLAERANGAAIGLLFDPEAARTAHQAGAGAEITIALGGKSSGKPFHGTFRVIAL